MTRTDGAAFPYPCVEVHVKDAKELLLLLKLARNLRATAAQRRCGWRCLREELRWIDPVSSGLRCHGSALLSH